MDHDFKIAAIRLWRVGKRALQLRHQLIREKGCFAGSGGDAEALRETCDCLVLANAEDACEHPAVFLCWGDHDESFKCIGRSRGDTGIQRSSAESRKVTVF